MGKKKQKPEVSRDTASALQAEHEACCGELAVALGQLAEARQQREAAEASHAEVDRVRKECDEKPAGYLADDACQALFCWRLACVLLVSLSATLMAIMFWAR